MLDYTGIKCPVCDVPFQQNDDIVVCPECGAPYHRACYQKEGKCIFEEELHKAGKAWEPPAPPVAPDPSTEIKDRECPICGTLNGHSALFCNRCGSSLVGEPQRYNNTYQNSNQEQGTVPPPSTPYGVPPVPQGNMYGGPFPFPMDPMGGVSPTEILDENVTFGDASKLIKQNTAYYMPVFRYMKQSGKNKFNFSAFLFSGAWMLYRKQYKFGILVTALMFYIYIAYLCFSIFIASPVLMELMQKAGMDLAEGFSPTNDQMIIISDIMSQNPIMYLQITLPMICLFCMLIVMIVVGFRGNKMYMKHCVRTVRDTKVAAAKTGEAEGALLEARGGVNVSIAICMFVCYMIIVNIPLFL